MSVTDQPLSARMPSGESSFLPRGPDFEGDLFPRHHDSYLQSQSQVAVSGLSTTEVGTFGRSIQAVWLVDEILHAFTISDLDSRLKQFQWLDTTLQNFLGMLM